MSNWRRRHPEFPAPVEVDGQELFLVEEIAAWLDGRKIPKKDLAPDELPGTTYGARFRNAMEIGRAAADAIDDALWRELGQFRGSEDIAVFADLVLGLLYLAATDDRRWNEIAATGGWRRIQLVERAALDHEPPLLGLHHAARGAFGDIRLFDDQLPGIVRLTERARLSGREADVFEFLVDRFAADAGRRDATLHTPAAVVRLLVELADPTPGASVFDPCCGTGGFLVGAAKHIAARSGRGPDASFTGRALSADSASLARMNLRLHGVRADMDATAGAIFRGEGTVAAEHFDVVLSNPPFDLTAPTEFTGPFGRLPKNRTSFAWLQHVTASLGEGGRAAVVMPGGTLFREGAEKHVRASMVDAGAVEAIIALPPQMFDATAVPVTVWLLRRPVWFGDAGEILFIDASKLGYMISRTQRSLSDEDRRRIVDTVTRWRGGERQAVRGFSASADVRRVREQDYRLMPARYVGGSAEPETPFSTVRELRDELARLEGRAAEVNDMVEQRLDGIRPWIR